MMLSCPITLKIPETLRQEAEAQSAALRAVMDGEDVEIIEKETQKLGEISMKIGEEIYKTAQENHPNPTDAN